MLFTFYLKKTWTKNAHFAQTQKKINWISVFWAKKQHFDLRPHGLKIKTFLTPENKGSGTQRPSIVTAIVP